MCNCLTAVGSDKISWHAQSFAANGPTGAALQDIYQKKDRLVGDCLLTSSFLSYCGAFTFEFRQQLLHELWTKDVAERKLPVSEPFRYDALFVALAVVQSRGVSFTFP